MTIARIMALTGILELLRRVSDLMAAATMESEKFECAICLDTRAFTEFSR